VFLCKGEREREREREKYYVVNLYKNIFFSDFFFRLFKTLEISRLLKRILIKGKRNLLYVFNFLRCVSTGFNKWDLFPKPIIIDESIAQTHIRSHSIYLFILKKTYLNYHVPNLKKRLMKIFSDKYPCCHL
jgi:hypothetical protein